MVLILLFTVFAEAKAPVLDCVNAYKDTLEQRVVGVETIHKVPGTTITVFLPMPASDKGAVLDLNSFDFDAAYPEQFYISDGTLKTAFVSVDLRADSTLSKCVDELAEKLGVKNAKSEKALKALTNYIAGYLKEVPDGFKFSWDPKRDVKEPREFTKAADLEPGHFPLKTSLKHNTTPLEGFLKAGKGVCLQKVLLTSLVMKKLDVPHRIRAGGTEHAGHLWIELTDGRHLDPTWNILKMPDDEGALPGWFHFDQSYLFQNAFFPISKD